jgi:hypothetical protein
MRAGAALLLPLLLGASSAGPLHLEPGPRVVVDLDIDKLWDGTPVGADEVVRVRLVDGGDFVELHVDAPFHDDPPPAGPPGPTWKLWEHEVVELFVVGVGRPEPYLEVEVGPHGHHVVIQLLGDRTVITARLLPLDYRAHIDGDRWTGVAKIPRDYLPFGAFRANAYTIHGVGASRRYLAWWPVPSEVPDFHLIEHFPPVPIP